MIDMKKFGLWAVVTGASSGIGKEFAKQLASSELNLVLVARRLSLLENLGRGLVQQFGIEYRAVQADLSDENFMPRIEEATNDIDVGLVISNAGAGDPGEFLDAELNRHLSMVRLNAISHLTLAHYFGQKMVKRGRGGILFVSAMGAPHGAPYMANDFASKAYVASLGQGLHEELKKYGVNVTVLFPGVTNTPVLKKLGFDVENMPMKPMSVEQCVAEALQALRANRASCLPGRLNRIMTAVMPSSMARKTAGKMLEENVKRLQIHSDMVAH
jgi:short-subunit dehydrogenase